MSLRPILRLSRSRLAVRDIKSLKDYETVARGKAAVIDFYADWCTPCKKAAPAFSQLSDEHPEVTFAKLNIDDVNLESVVAGHGISSVPTFLVIQDGKIVNLVAGANMKAIKESLTKLASPN